MRRITFGHIVNPVAVDETSDLFVAQPITFETMRRARAAADPGLEITFFSAQYPEDREAVPPDFVPTRDLERSARDLHPPVTDRKLPFPADILDRLYHASDAEYLIYTNVDIGLKPPFYNVVADLIGQGYDALAFTRRNISGEFTSVDQIPQMYVADANGRGQRGPDCYVFERELHPRLELGDVFTGEPGVARAILANLFRHARQPRFVTDGELTFHIRNDGLWKSRRDRAGRTNLERSLIVVEKMSRESDDERRDLIRPHLEAVQRMLARASAP